jgi:hypothetical protein
MLQASIDEFMLVSPPFKQLVLGQVGNAGLTKKLLVAAPEILPLLISGNRVKKSGDTSTPANTPYIVDVSYHLHLYPSCQTNLTVPKPAGRHWVLTSAERRSMLSKMVRYTDLHQLKLLKQLIGRHGPDVLK